MDNTSTRVITGRRTRFSYLCVLEPKSMNGGPAKYSGSFIIPKTDKATVAKVRSAIEAAYKDGLAKLKGTGRTAPALESLHTPLRDGDKDRPDDPAYANAWFINASSMQKPGIVDSDLNPIIDPEQIYSGAYGRVSLTFFAYNTNGNRGIAAGLNNIQKLEDGERFSGRNDPTKDFATEEEDYLA